MKPLTPSQEHYIKGILVLSSDGEGVRICDVAEKLGVSKPSVCVAAKNLERMGLIKRDYSRQIILTTRGREQANLVMDKLAIIKSFLVDILQVDMESAQRDACAIEHVVSNETLCSMCRQNSQRSEKHICPKNCRIKKK